MKNQIVVCQWGATMTLQTFARITKETPKTVKVVLLKSKVSDTKRSDTYGTNYVEPTDTLSTDWADNPETLTLFKTESGYFTKKHGYYQFYKLWDGTPQFEDHND